MKKGRFFAYNYFQPVYIKPFVIALMVLLNVLPSAAQYAYSSPKKNVTLTQAGAEDKITLSVKNERLDAVLEKIEKQTGLLFVYANDEVDVSQRVSIAVSNKAVPEAVKQLLNPLGISFMIVKDKIILQSSKQKLPLTGGSNSNSNTDRAFAAIEDHAITISGRVTDEGSKGLAFVNVVLKGTGNGTSTSTDGSYSLSIPDNQNRGTLVFSLVGYVPQELPIEGTTVMNVRLVSDSKELTDVVVVGYGTQRKISVTGAVDGISRKAIEGRPVTNLATALQGVSPNLIIQQRNFEPGQGVNINIRGLGTLGDNTPLVVIDGIMGGDINLINPSDIDNISVLKDAGTAAIYGSRSANGVILITTKKGRKNSAPRVTYSGIYGTQSPRITYHPVHAWENAYYKNESLANSGLAPAFTPSEIKQFADRGDGDWRVDNILHQAPQQSHNISVSG
ncbi:MAG: TonB-dependent receptor plug domain-containing protein, partial [Ferruginibacter sp.]